MAELKNEQIDKNNLKALLEKIAKNTEELAKTGNTSKSTTSNSSSSKRRTAEQIAKDRAEAEIAQQKAEAARNNAIIASMKAQRALDEQTRSHLELQAKWEQLQRSRDEARREAEKRYEESYKESKLYKGAEAIKGASHNNLTSIGISAATGGIINPAVAKALGLDKAVNAALGGLAKSALRKNVSGTSSSALDNEKPLNRIPKQLDQITKQLEKMNDSDSGDPSSSGKKKKGLFGTILSAAGGLVSTILPNLLTVVPGAIMLLLPKLTNFIEDIIKNKLMGQGMSEGLAGGVSGVIMDMLPMALIGLRYGGFQGALLGGILGLVVNNIDTIVEWWHKLTAWFKENPIGQKISEIFGIFKKSIVETAQSIWAFGEAIGEGIAWVVNGVTTGFEQLWSFGEKIGEGVAWAWNGITTFIDKAGSFISKTGAAIKKGAIASWDYTKKLATTAWNGAIDGAKSAWNFVKDIASKAWDKITSTATSIWTNIKDWIIEKFNSVIQGFKEFCDDPIGFATKRIKNVATGVKDTAVGWWNKAKSYVGLDSNSEVGGDAPGQIPGAELLNQYSDVPWNDNLMRWNKNIPGSIATNLNTMHDEVISPLQTALGNHKIIMTSSYRDQAYNARIGGASKSNHITGNAMDLVVQGMSPQQVVNVLQKAHIPFERAITEKNRKGQEWLHLEYNRNGNHLGATAHIGADGRYIQTSSGSNNATGSYSLETNDMNSLDAQNSLQLAINGSGGDTTSSSASIDKDISFASNGSGSMGGGAPIVNNMSSGNNESSVYPVGDAARTLLFVT